MTVLDPHATHSDHPGWPFPAKVAFVGFLGIALFFLWTEHRAHLFAYWPFLLVLACPLMHVFMHHGDQAKAKPMTSVPGEPMSGISGE